MRLIKQNGKTFLRITKKEWEGIGKKAIWNPFRKQPATQPAQSTDTLMWPEESAETPEQTQQKTIEQLKSRLNTEREEVFRKLVSTPEWQRVYNTLEKANDYYARLLISILHGHLSQDPSDPRKYADFQDFINAIKQYPEISKVYTKQLHDIIENAFNRMNQIRSEAGFPEQQSAAAPAPATASKKSIKIKKGAQV